MEEIIQKMESNIGLIILGLLAFSVVLAIVEFCYELYKKKITRWRLGEMWASFSVYLVAQLTEKIGTAVFVGVFFLIADLIPWQLPINGWTMLLAIILIDFLYYWEHRLEHEIRILWTYHSIHHSSPIYNYTTALRVSFIDNFTTWLFYVPAILLGFHPIMVLLAVALMLMYQFWLHTELIGKLGWYEKIFMTPSQHRVHHGSDEIYLDKNYGAILSIWDRMFGTYQEELHKPTYGLTTQINTINPIKVHAFEYVNIWKDLRKAKNGKEVWNYLFKGPGWKPDREL
ncbi:MAG: sterol desaturase family protein [Flammeovirgaceae bacterium]